ncbi:MAG: YfcE family phosphodiesterase [Thermoproteota archaeon]|nr:YfcE family phosphodiesterase [Thermoproteota archaeon]
MKIGIISDTHDDLNNIRKSVRVFTQKQVSLIIHAGDFIFPGAVAELAKLKEKVRGVKIVGVLGNNDGEKLILSKTFMDIADAELKSDFDDRIIDGLRFGTYHGTSRELREAAIQSGIYDVFIHGHTHQRRNEIVEITCKESGRSKKTHVLNPGTAHDRFPNIEKKLEVRPTVIIYDTGTQTCQFVDLNTREPIKQPLKITRHEI